MVYCATHYTNMPTTSRNTRRSDGNARTKSSPMNTSQGYLKRAAQSGRAGRSSRNPRTKSALHTNLPRHKKVPAGATERVHGVVKYALHTIPHFTEHSQLHHLVRHARSHTLTVLSRAGNVHHRLNRHKTTHTIVTRQRQRRRAIIVAPRHNNTRPMTTRTTRNIQHCQSRTTRHSHKNLQK